MLANGSLLEPADASAIAIWASVRSAADLKATHSSAVRSAGHERQGLQQRALEPAISNITATFERSRRQRTEGAGAAAAASAAASRHAAPPHASSFTVMFAPSQAHRAHHACAGDHPGGHSPAEV